MKPNFVNLVGVGDVFINGVLADLISSGDYIAPFTPVLDPIGNAEIKFFNLEGPLSIRGKSLEKFCLHSIPDAVNSLSKAGFNIASLANNHIFDYGVEAFEDTCSALSRNGIAWFGAGHNISEATKPAIIESNGLKIGFLGYSWSFTDSIDAKLDTPGVAPLNKELILNNVTSLKSQVDIVVVSLHWCYEREQYPLPYHRKLAHDIIDSGASLILGHHPHVLQGIESYKNGVIAFSLGNFIFPDFDCEHFQLRQRDKNKESVIFRCKISKDKVEEWHVIPIKANDSFQPVPQNGTEGDRILNELTILSEPLKKGNYWFFWSNHRIRKDLPQVKRNNTYYRQKLRLHRLRTKAIAKFRKA